MKELLHDAEEEIKRADHLIYVSLKYTRTVDMFRHIIKRMINAIDFTMDSLLKNENKKDKTKELPKSPGMKVEVMKEKFSDERILDMISFYLFLRKVMRVEYKKAREYRRHVTMSVVVEGIPVDINIDLIHEYFNKIKEHVSYVKEIILGKNE